MRAPSAPSSRRRSSISPRWPSCPPTGSSAAPPSWSNPTAPRPSPSTHSGCCAWPGTTVPWTGPTRPRSWRASPSCSPPTTGPPSSEPAPGLERTAVFRVRWLGRVPYAEAHALQRALHDRGDDDHLLLLEHPHVFTLGAHADRAHVLVDPDVVGAELVATDRGGDVTYHGPGQLVAYPVVNVPTAPRSVPSHVEGIEQIVIDTLAELGVRAGRLAGYPGVWVDADGAHGAVPRKIC